MHTPRSSVARLAVPLALGAVLAAPLLAAGRDSLALLAWLTLLAAPLGALLGAGLYACRPRANGALPGGTLAVAVLALAGAALTWRALPRPAPAPFVATLAALLGLALAGGAFARVARVSSCGAVSLAGALLVVGCALAVLPSLGGLWRGVPWPPPVAAWLLGLSPLTLTAESAGVDWMRHSFVYEPAGTASIGPDLRSAWGVLAGPTCFVVGCALALAVRALDRRARSLESPAR